MGVLGTVSQGLRALHKQVTSDRMMVVGHALCSAYKASQDTHIRSISQSSPYQLGEHAQNSLREPSSAWCTLCRLDLHWGRPHHDRFFGSMMFRLTAPCSTNFYSCCSCLSFPKTPEWLSYFYTTLSNTVRALCSAPLLRMPQS